MEIIVNEWTGFFDSLENKLANPEPLLIQVGETVAQCTRENFGITGTNRPSDWQTPLSESYQGKLRRQGIERDYPTLFLSGDLYESITVQNPSLNSISVIATDQKASWHQIGEGNNPTRPFFPVVEENKLTDYCENRIEQVTERHFSNL